MIVDKVKLERQELGVQRWFDSGKQGTINYATGVGKTYTAMLIMKRLFRLDPLHNVVIIVPSEALQGQWNIELNKHFTKKDLIRVTVKTVNWVIVNKIKIKTGTAIYDEVHEYLADEYFKVVNGGYIRYDNGLALTATYEDSQRRHKKLELIFPIIDRITEKEAIEKGYISPFIEFNLSVVLTKEEQEAYNEYTTIISNTINKFGRGGLSLAIKCLQGGKDSKGREFKATHFVYGWATFKGWRRDLNLEDERDRQINDLWNPHVVFGYAQKLMNGIRKRKDLLYGCNSKAKICKELAFKFNNLKTIVFSQSTAFADKLNLLLNEEEKDCSVVYHSSLQTVMLPSPKTGKLIKFGKTRLKRVAIENFRSGKATKICTASSLDKGFDVQDTRLGITASGTSNFTQYKQRGGRVKRKDMFNTDKIALLVNLYVKNSADEKWLNKRQSMSTNKLHWVDSIDEISFTPTNKEEFTINDI